MKLKTATGKRLVCDAAIKTENPSRLFLHLKETDLQMVSAIFSNPQELPLVGYSEFMHLVTLTVLANGRINICLK